MHTLPVRHSLLATALLLFPVSAFATKNFGPSDSDMEILFTGMLYVAAAFAAPLLNLQLKKLWLRVVSIALALPLFLLSAFLTFFVPPLGIFGMMVVLLIGLIIYGSYEQKPAA